APSSNTRPGVSPKAGSARSDHTRGVVWVPNRRPERRPREKVLGDEELGVEFRLVLAVLLDGHRVADVILVDALDLQEALGDAFLAHAELLRDAPARGVARHDRGLDAMEPEHVERVAQQQQHTFRHVAAPGFGLVDPVTDVRGLERSALHTPEADLTKK